MSFVRFSTPLSFFHPPPMASSDSNLYAGPSNLYAGGPLILGVGFLYVGTRPERFFFEVLRVPCQNLQELGWSPRASTTSLPPVFRSLGNGVRKNGVRNRCPYRRCGVDTEIPYRLPVWREFCWFLPVRVAPGVDTEFPYRVRIVDRGVDCRDPVCRHRFQFLEFLIIT